MLFTCCCCCSPDPLLVLRSLLKSDFEECCCCCCSFFSRRFFSRAARVSVFCFITVKGFVLSGADGGHCFVVFELLLLILSAILLVLGLNSIDSDHNTR